MPAGKPTSIAVAGAVLALGAAAAFVPVTALSEPPMLSLSGSQPGTEPASLGVGVRTTGRLVASLDRAAITASIPPHSEIITNMPPVGADIAALRAGLDALAADDFAGARLYRMKLSDQLDRHILTWVIAMSGEPEVTSAEIAAAMHELAHWPGAEQLKANWERALYREKPAPEAVIRAFTGGEPRTSHGVRLLARAHLATGDADKARAALSPFWRTKKLEPADEAAIIKEFGALIPAADHRLRMERMLYAERPKSAQRVASLAGAKELADAWSAVLRNDKTAGKLLDKVPEAQQSTGYLFARAKYLRRKKDFAAAAETMLKAPNDPAALVDPDEWWLERRMVSRELVDRGDLKTAYKLVSARSGETVNSLVDAEFHAGWYALRGLNDPAAAATHFANIAAVADGPLSKSRAYYWLGRAAEAGGGGDATAYYKTAARYGTAFYGQLAAARIGVKSITIDYPSPSERDLKTFGSRAAVRAIRRLEFAGYASRADVLYRELAGQLDSEGELSLLAGLAEARGDHFLALRVGKIAANRGFAIGSLSHPVGVIPASADISGAGKALAYAIARQESEFNVAAVSGAGARGLLQLLPGTAKEMALKNGLPFSKNRLTTDAAYNATLGAAFLQDQLGRFDGSYVLTFVGYNAGPGRAKEWIRKYGDPRGKTVDQVVDWIERIPFTETRNYVQRVMENYEVYRMRLSGDFDIARDLVNGR
jgi:soluble lytic murein transglycosylase